MDNNKFKKVAIFILIPLSLVAAIYANMKIFAPDSIWSWQYWIHLIIK